MRPQRDGGFTLLELMVAVTIFAIISVAVLAVFRTGTRAYQNSHREADVLRRARFAMDTFETDIQTIFYRDETSYNVQARRRLELYQTEFLEAERTRNWEAFESKYGPEGSRGRRDGGDGAAEDPDRIGNPFEKGRIIDLNFVGEDSDAQDTLTFAVQYRPEVGRKSLLWGLSRVKWAVDNGVLIRSAESVEAPPRDWMGEVLEKPEKPEHLIVAEGVQEFDLAYAFWFDNQWYEVGQWSSANRQIRNSLYLLGEYEFDEREQQQIERGQVVPGAEGWNEFLNESDGQPLDRVPTYVRVKMAISDPVNPKRLTRLMRVIRVPNSQETYLPNGDLEEDEQETERELRDDEYLPVFPGAMEKE